MTDYFENLINAFGVKCPVHDTKMIGKRHEVKTGYRGIVRKIMYVGICPEKDCGKWFEFLPPDGVLWP